MNTADLLFEIGTEELPPMQLKPLSQALGDTLQAQLNQANLTYERVVTFASPRRLAVIVYGLVDQQPTQTVERRGPALSAAFDAAGKPTPACAGFARGCGVEVETLEQRETPKGVWLFYQQTQAGKSTVALLPSLIEQALKKLPTQRMMRWGAHTTAFVRPVHWVVLLFGEHVVPGVIFGQTTGNQTQGHRFHHPDALTIEHPSVYQETLADIGHVVVDWTQREALIRQEAQHVAAAHGTVLMPDDLLAEVVGLVEKPAALLGTFDAIFLDLPPEVLMAVMKKHQKCFPVQHATGMSGHFVIISNIQSKDPAQVIKGNERVMRARLADAAFFYAQDRESNIENWHHELNDIVFLPLPGKKGQNGVISDRCHRIETLAAMIAPLIGADPETTQEAARLSKIDMRSAMVEEFPELSGIMGAYYARHAGKSEAIAHAIASHHLPRFAADALPDDNIGRALALADRIDLLVNIFGINQAPTGEKDPLGARRAALGILRILIECRLDLDLPTLFEHALKGYGDAFQQQPERLDELSKQLSAFMLNRLRAWCLDQQITPAVFAAVASQGLRSPLDFYHRLQAVAAFQAMPASIALCAAHKRVNQFLKKQSLQVPYPIPDSTLFETDAEHDLFKALTHKKEDISPLAKTKDYTGILTALADLQTPIDAFFDQVLVMAKEENIRKNRIALLVQLRGLFEQVADISQL
jgi:glycyl-tRNA synthetase beta chain